MHVWDEPSPALMQFDVYSCGEFDPEEICKKIQKDFDIVRIEYKFIDRETELKDIAGGRSIQKARIKDLIIKETEEKEKLYKEKILLKSRKEVNINENGSGYTVKQGPHKGKVLGHIQLTSKNI